MYRLYDTFGKATVSRHRTLEAMCRADKKYQRMIRRNNGQNSYIPTAYRNDDLSPITDDEYQFCLSYLQNV